MATILAFAGSNSSTSINFKLVKYTSGLIQQNEVKVMDLSLFPVPMYSADTENDHGYPEDVVGLQKDIKNADGLIISVNEHNSGPSAYFKNLMDWLSRVDKRFLEEKKIFLMSTSPGKRGAISSLTYVKDTLPRFGGEIATTFSLPSFNDNFDPEKGILDGELKVEHQEALADFLKTL
ncbi:NADPH-dependent FMN reductase [Sediminicola sp. YIK13]|uniref:NADPH-dependent FMN reductase n=1 Tax=Sediminicola sp. YIK13 TaxID=1453352 RepID=UPI00071F2CAC|nr:NAD(P)H-dependent oxidoreductase [Sediminicola sp. YIK13]ALM06945.1 NADPH-dependent FMN reductase [Sediminicola sp. YIK13]